MHHINKAVFILVNVLVFNTIQAQTLQLLSTLQPGTTNTNFNSGDHAAWAITNNNLYYLFDNQNGKFQLGRYSSTGHQMIPNLNASDIGPQDAQLAFNGKVYTIYATASGKQQLAELNGTTYTLFSNPDNGNGFIGYPVVFNNAVYYKYKDVNAKARLAKFDGVSVTLVNNPSASDPGFHNNPIVYNNKLYFAYKKSTGKHVLAQYDGFNISLINNPSATDAGFHSSEPILFGGKLCLRYTGNGVKNNLAIFDGTTLNVISNFNALDLGYNGKPVIYNSKLFITYGNASIPTKYQLASWDGVSLSLIANPNTTTTGIFGSMVVMNNKLYTGFVSSATMNQLISYDGSSFVFYSNVATNDKGIVEGIQPVASNGFVFFLYQVSNGGLRLAKCNGSTISLFSNPDAGQPFVDLTPVKMTFFNNQIFLNYNQASGNRQLAYFNPCSSVNITINDSICVNSYYSFNGQLLNTPGNYTVTFTSASGCDSTVTLHLSTYSCTNTNLKLFVQGYYSGGSLQPVLQNSGLAANATDCDFLRIELHAPSAPYNLIHSVNAMLKTNGTVVCPIPSNLSGGNYYISIRHRSALETWSSLPVLMNSLTNYDFTISANKAFSGNQLLVAPGKYAFYNGDLDHDGAIDAFDYMVISPDIEIGNFGYLHTDLNGDGVVDIFDNLVLEPNILNGVGAIAP